MSCTAVVSPIEIFSADGVGRRRDWTCANQHVNRDLALAWQIIAAPMPLGFLISAKIEVLLHYQATAGQNMAPLDRLVLTGLGTLRADVVNFCG